MLLFFIKFGFFDVLDILIVAFIFYQIYRLVKGTVAINIFAGIFIFYLAWLLVRAFNMELISSILGQFIGMGVIALLIVFQQEVRRFLLLVGSKYNLQNIFNLNGILAKPEIKEDVSDAIVEACERFSASYTGALIVFAQNTELFTYAQTGVLLKAQVTDELIENIFFKNTPLHDGAVIIADNKILAARCILPVSDRMDIPGSMGLRHRAALGLSAVSDAMIVVVSEETGKITFFKDGNYKVRVTPEELKKFLSKDFAGFVVK
ncbi:diadenylate cyclase CdaA [Odoribacter lunatus]|uniref:diadenylate cyclase CdaA n=1 Tax=Odoribacter lunatus TaxID=2941335 RepID=UPI0020417AA3|nr:diadenylate cyclase CdaA [Odoribacter lunatus]